MINLRANAILLSLIFVPGVLMLVGCAGDPAPVSTATRAVVTPVPTTTPPPPTVAAATVTTAPPAPTATNTALPTPAPLTAINEADGWVTYRNEIVGYEISVPAHYQIKGFSPDMGWIGSGLLGPAVPDEEVASLLAKYYGQSLCVFLEDPDPTGPVEHFSLGIYAYDILVDTLGASISLGGIGDYELSKASETLTIDGQDYEVTFTVLQKHGQTVGEGAVLYLEPGGVQFLFGYSSEKDDPEEYQAYRKEVWPVLRRIVESYQYRPKGQGGS